MAIIKNRVSSVPGKKPLTTNMNIGEVAINSYDGTLYIKKDVEGTESIVEVGKLENDISPKLSADLNLAGNNITSTGEITITGSGNFITLNSDYGVMSQHFVSDDIQLGITNGVVGTILFPEQLTFLTVNNDVPMIIKNNIVEFSPGTILVGLKENTTGCIEKAEVKEYVLDLFSLYNYSVDIIHIKSSSGTCTAKLQCNNVDIVGFENISVSTTKSDYVPSGTNSVLTGQKLSLVITANSDAEMISFSIHTTRVEVV